MLSYVLEVLQYSHIINGTFHIILFNARNKICLVLYQYRLTAASTVVSNTNIIWNWLNVWEWSYSDPSGISHKNIFKIARLVHISVGDRLLMSYWHWLQYIQQCCIHNNRFYACYDWNIHVFKINYNSNNSKLKLRFYSMIIDLQHTLCWRNV